MDFTGYVPTNEIGRRAHEQYMKSLEALKTQFRNNLFDLFDGKITKSQVEKIQKDSYRLSQFCEIFGIDKIYDEDGKAPRLLPDGKMFKNAGEMIKELFSRLEEKNKELNACSRRLSGQGFKSDVNHFHSFTTHYSYSTFKYNPIRVVEETTLEEIEREIEEGLVDIYAGNNETFDETKQASLVDMLSYLFRTNSILFINKFKELKSKDLKERFNQAKKELIELFNPERVTLKQLENLEKTVSGINNLSSEINKM